MSNNFISDEDKALFREYICSIKPLNKKTTLTSSRAKLQIQEKKPISSLLQEQSNHYLSDVIKDTVLSETVLSYAQPTLPNRRFKALKNGCIPWEARLDLHGLNTEQARYTLCQFIQIHTENNTGCLLIIHGKGGCQGAPPVIKNQLNRWLPQLDEVLAFHSALGKDGGNGAVYVLLKKNR